MSLSVKYSVLLILIFFIVLVVSSLMVGRYSVSLADLLNGLQSENIQNNQGWRVILDIRLPRILAAILVGAALSVAGAVYQIMFRNPLVSPDILGVSAGAGLGATLAIFMDADIWLIELSAFSFGLLAVLLVYLLSMRLQRLDNTLVLILTGVVISALFSAIISLLKIMADPYTQLSSMTFWLMGGLNTVQYTELFYTLPCVLLAFIPIILLRWRINLLNLTDDESRTLGISPHRIRFILILAATLMTSSVVAITGLIGWVGLIIPHIARMLVGARFSYIFFLSVILGPMFLLIADTAARVVAPIDLPLSILTSFIGAPFFIFLLINKNRKT